MKKKVLVFALLLLGAGAIGSFWAWDKYKAVFYPNVRTPNEKPFGLYIKTGSSFKDVTDSLYTYDLIVDRKSFSWVAKAKGYPERIKPGHYELRNDMSNNELINMLRGGRQKTINVTFNSIRTIEQLAGRVSKQIEADSAELVELLSSNAFISKMGFTQQTILSMCIPNTYEFYWNTSAPKFCDKMHQEYQRFWNDDRKAKANAIGLTPDEVATLASIVQAEQSRYNEEKPIIAGLYINRLNVKMPLQSDPTVIFAAGDFTIQRVLNRHLEIDSPYNTYKYAGLPPGPINMPEVSSLDAVLNYQKHEYFYMCAKEDFSGYHYFAKTHDQHIVNARKYRDALNRRGIR